MKTRPGAGADRDQRLSRGSVKYIVEFNPRNDIANMTATVAAKLLMMVQTDATRALGLGDR